MSMLTPRLTRAQVRRVDAIAIEELEIPGVVLMENAGRGAALIVREHADRRRARRVVVLCGRGNNGGDGYVIARHLLNAGWTVEVHSIVPVGELRGDAEINHRIVRNMGVDVGLIDTAERMRGFAERLGGDDVVVDALLGTGFQGEVRQPLAELIDAVNEASTAGVVAVDLPSGMNCDTGRPGGVAIRADLTVTFVAAKAGMIHPEAEVWTGRVEVVDIGTPPALIERVLREGPE